MLDGDAFVRAVLVIVTGRALVVGDAFETPRRVGLVVDGVDGLVFLDVGDL